MTMRVKLEKRWIEKLLRLPESGAVNRMTSRQDAKTRRFFRGETERRSSPPQSSVRRLPLLARLAD